MLLNKVISAGTRLVLVAVLLSSGRGLAAGADRTRYFPLDHPAYHYLDRLQERGLLLSLDRSLRPYTRQQVSRALSLQKRDRLHAFESAWIEWIERECALETLDRTTSPSDSAAMRVIVRSEASAEMRSLPPDRHDETVALGFGGQFGTLVYDARFARAPHLLVPPDSTEHRDPDVLPPLVEGLIRPLEGYLKADWASGGGSFGAELFFGRLARNWSPRLESSLILSGRSLGFDHLALAIRSRHLTFSHLVARLDDMEYRLPDGSYVRANRYFSAHRLDIRLRDHVRFGISESTVYGGPGAGFDPALMNPFTSYRLTAIQDNRSHANNTLVALDGFVCLRQRLSLHGQFLFDDFLREKNIQNRWAFQGGVDLRDPPLLEGSTAGARFDFASSFVYNTFKPWERYLVSGRSLGAEHGSDYWSAGVFLRRFIGPRLDLKASLDLNARGERRIAMPVFDLLDSAGLPFPTPVVMRSVATALELRWQPSDWATLTAGGGFIRERNLNNHPGEDRRRGFGSVALSLYRDIPISF